MAINKESEEDWWEILTKIRVWAEVRFASCSQREKEIWQYIVLVAAHLEFRALAALWVHSGKRGFFEDFEGKLTLGQAASRLDELRELDAQTIETLHEVAKLRNSVVHRQATYGLGALLGASFTEVPHSGLYRGIHVFSDRAGLDRLVDDSDTATQVLSAWVSQHDPAVRQGNIGHG